MGAVEIAYPDQTISPNGGNLIIRGFDSSGYGGSADIYIPRLGKIINIQFKRGEIKTIRVPLDPNLPFFETSITEDIMEEKPKAKRGNGYVN